MYVIPYDFYFISVLFIHSTTICFALDQMSHMTNTYTSNYTRSCVDEYTSKFRRFNHNSVNALMPHDCGK